MATGGGEERVYFGMNKFGPNRNTRNSFVQIACGGGERTNLCHRECCCCSRSKWKE